MNLAALLGTDFHPHILNWAYEFNIVRLHFLLLFFYFGLFAFIERDSERGERTERGRDSNQCYSNQFYFLTHNDLLLDKSWLAM